MAEAWQAQALARAVGGRLASCGPAEVRTEARELGETSGPATAVPDHPVVPAGEVRARLLTEVADVRVALTSLARLLGEVGIALVGIACDTEDGLYWQCIEAIDAVDESVDRVHAMLRRLAELPHDHGTVGEGEHEHGRGGGPGPERESGHERESGPERESGHERDGPCVALGRRAESRPVTS